MENIPPLTSKKTVFYIILKFIESEKYFPLFPGNFQLLTIIAPVFHFETKQFFIK